MFALAHRMGYEMRPIARQRDTLRPPQGKRPFADQNRGSVLRHGPVETTPRSSVSPADNSDICSPVARDRTPRYHSNQRVGISNRTVVHREMAIVNRETPPRAGPHPHRSAHTSFDPQFIFIHSPVIGFFITGPCDHLYSSTINFMYRNTHVVYGSGSYRDTGVVYT